MKIGNQNDTLTLISGQEVSLLKLPGLSKITFSCLLPAVRYPFAQYPGGVFQNPKNYLDPAKRQDILSKIEVDAVSVENLCAEMSTILNTLKEIAYREEVPFEKDISITVTDGHGEYETRRACKEAYGAMASGVFSLDTLKFLSKNEVWMTLPEIIGQKTDIRIFAIDDNRMRAIAEKPILIWQGKNQRILEFTYDEDVVFRLRDHAYAEIKLHFER